MPDALLKREEVELPFGWWHDLSFRGGVEKRVGWWMEIPFKVRAHFYVVAFRDGTRGPVMMGTNPWEEIE